MKSPTDILPIMKRKKKVYSFLVGSGGTAQDLALLKILAPRSRRWVRQMKWAKKMGERERALQNTQSTYCTLPLYLPR